MEQRMSMKKEKKAMSIVTEYNGKIFMDGDGDSFSLQAIAGWEAGKCDSRRAKTGFGTDLLYCGEKK